MVEKHLKKKNVSPHEFLEDNFPTNFKTSDDYGFFKSEKMSKLEAAGIDELHLISSSTLHKVLHKVLHLIPPEKVK